MSSEQSNTQSSAPLKGTPGRLKAKLGKGESSPAPKGSGGAGATQAAGASPASMTVKRSQNAANLNQELAVDLAQWFARVNPNSKLGAVTDPDQFFTGLQTGVELCDIVNIVRLISCYASDRPTHSTHSTSPHFCPAVPAKPLTDCNVCCWPTDCTGIQIAGKSGRATKNVSGIKQYRIVFESGAIDRCSTNLSV